ncbi:MAG: serine--tRNA ligase [Myxococcota bacterium]
MLDPRLIREDLEAVRQNCRRRHCTVDLDRIAGLDERRRVLRGELDEVRRQRNALARALKRRKPEEAERERGRELKEREGELDRQLQAATREQHELWSQLPNLTHPEVPSGAGEEDNVERRRHGEPPRFDFDPLDHVELAELHDLIDFEAGARVVGQKFYYLKNEMVLLEQALIRYALDRLRARGFVLFQTPDLARTEIAEGMGFQPRGEETQIYSIEGEPLVLVGTAEITLGGLHRDQILDTTSLPLRYCGLSHCYRTEAGAHGRAGRGLYRVHQFTKVEMFAFTHPDASDAMLEELVEIEEELFRGLELPTRVMEICTGDLGAPKWRSYDLEAWMPGRGVGGSYGEVTSASNCTDYQARRLGVRFRDPDSGRTRFVHMLNGTAIAMTRAPIALLENHQQADHSIRIPEALRPYTGFDQIG